MSKGSNLVIALFVTVFLETVSCNSLTAANKTFFLATGGPYTFAEAKEACSTQNGLLATIGTAQQLADTEVVLTNYSNFGWIDLAYDSGSSGYKWMTDGVLLIAAGVEKWSSIGKEPYYQKAGYCVAVGSGDKEWRTNNCTLYNRGLYNITALCMRFDGMGSTAATTDATMAIGSGSSPSTSSTSTAATFSKTVAGSLSAKGSIKLSDGSVIDAEAPTLPASLANSSSVQFKELANMFRTSIVAMYSSGNVSVVSCLVKGFRKGSVVADYEVALKSLTQMSDAEIKAAIEAKFGQMKAGGSTSEGLTLSSSEVKLGSTSSLTTAKPTQIKQNSASRQIVDFSVAIAILFGKLSFA